MNGGRVLLLGLTFKQNCADIRNTKVIDMQQELVSYGLNIDMYDPCADPYEVRSVFGVEMLPLMPEPLANYDAVILAVPHNFLVEIGANGLKAYLSNVGVFFDMKSVFEQVESHLRL